MTASLTQKEAVFQAVTSVLTEAGVSFEVESSVFKELMTKELRAQVNSILFEGFRAGNIELEGEKSDAELKQYVSGLQTNWLNKDKRLNGNVGYVAKNPGSRAGSSDAQIKALRALIATKTDASEIAEIQSYIDERVATLNSEKKAKKAPAIDMSALPAELQAKYS